MSSRDHLSADLKVVDLRMHNWSRWAYMRLGGPGHCGSVEHRYRPERYADEMKLEKTAMPVDFADAERVERALCMIQQATKQPRLLSEGQKKNERFALAFVRCHYEKRYDWRKTSRKLHIDWKEFESVHRRVLYQMEAALHRVALQDGQRGVQSTLKTATA